MQTHDFIAPFKENRNYVQGAELFNEMIGYFANKNLADIHFTVHKMITNNQGTMYLTASLEEFKTLSQAHATAYLKVNNKEYWIAFLFKNEPLIEITHIPYDENLLIEKCQTNGENIFLKEISPYTLIETMVSMHKKLVLTLYPNTGKWLSTKIILANYNANYKNIMISFRKNFNFKLVRSDIFIDDVLAGEIYFSLVTG